MISLQHVLGLLQVKQGKEPALFSAYFQAWDASYKQRTTADYEARVAALNSEAAKAADAGTAQASTPCASSQLVSVQRFGS